VIAPATSPAPTRAGADPDYLRIRDAALLLGYRHPQFLLLWDRVRHLVTLDDTGAITGTACVDAGGRIVFARAFLRTLSAPEIGGVLAHELLHLVYAHHLRQGGRDARIWNLAADACINGALREDGITLPAGAYFAPADYTGTLQAEPLHDHLAQNPPPPPPGGKGKGKPGEDPADGDPQVGQGCGVRPAPAGAGGEDPADSDGQGQDPAPGALRPGETWADVRALVEATCAQIGSGSGAVRRLLQPAPARTDWRALLRRGAQIAQGAQVREAPTYAKASRRQIPGTLRPGYTSTRPRLAVVIDVSGSMDRAWVDQCVAECQRMVRTWPGLRVYVATHTDDLIWAGWIGEAEGARGAWEDATGATGGTDPAPAFRAVEASGASFDALIHFTDCELVRWERASNARRFLIGACGAGADGRPFAPFPEDAEVVPVEVGRGQ
jgi:hypothetical protein